MRLEPVMPVFAIERETGDVKTYPRLDDLRLVVEEFWDVLDDEFEFWDSMGRRLEFEYSFLRGDASGLRISSDRLAEGLTRRLVECASKHGVVLTESEQDMPALRLYQIIVERLKADRA